jgi:hypothetical protein
MGLSAFKRVRVLPNAFYPEAPLSVFFFFFFFFGVGRRFFARPHRTDYLKRTVTCVSTDSFCTGMWIGMVFCPFLLFVLFFHCDSELTAP